MVALSFITASSACRNSRAWPTASWAEPSAPARAAPSTSVKTSLAVS